MFTFPLSACQSRRVSNMTPTRTDRADTTLHQRRRAFNNISLNNTRSDVHSSEKAGRGACSTVVSRVNNERKSNNTYKGHNREQLINWLMSKDAVASCFIKDVLSMSESEHAGGTRLFASFAVIPTQQATGLPHYFLGRVPCRSISLVAVVVGATAYEKRVVYIREPYYLPSHGTTPNFAVQWMMERAPSSAHFALARVRISRRAKRVRIGTVLVTPTPQLEYRQIQALVLLTLSSQSVPWSMFRAKFE